MERQSEAPKLKLPGVDIDAIRARELAKLPEIDPHDVIEEEIPEIDPDDITEDSD